MHKWGVQPHTEGGEKGRNRERLFRVSCIAVDVGRGVAVAWDLTASHWEGCRAKRVAAASTLGGSGTVEHQWTHEGVLLWQMISVIENERGGRQGRISDEPSLFLRPASPY
jgi:hypothetical protein